MLKKNLTIFRKIRVVYWLMTNLTNCGIMQECGVCGSIKVVGTKAKAEKDKSRKQISRAKYKCLKCGAVAKVKEKWRS